MLLIPHLESVKAESNEINRQNRCFPDSLESTIYWPPTLPIHIATINKNIVDVSNIFVFVDIVKKNEVICHSNRVRSATSQHDRKYHLQQQRSSPRKVRRWMVIWMVRHFFTSSSFWLRDWTFEMLCLCRSVDTSYLSLKGAHFLPPLKFKFSHDSPRKGWHLVDELFLVGPTITLTLTIKTESVRFSFVISHNVRSGVEKLYGIAPRN